jgi:hypothetical protein
MTAFNGGAVRSVPTSQQHAPAAVSDESESSDGDTYPQGEVTNKYKYYMPPQRLMIDLALLYKSPALLIAKIRKAAADQCEREEKTDWPFGIPKDLWDKWKNDEWTLNITPQNYVMYYQKLVAEWEKITKNGKLGL